MARYRHLLTAIEHDHDHDHDRDLDQDLDHVIDYDHDNDNDVRRVFFFARTTDAPVLFKA